MYVVVIDEAESILGTRQEGSEHPWYNSWVNQFLGKLDGLQQLDNIFVIIMTNRPDIIDKALLRPGRIELHLELALPGLQGRKEIFAIHTKGLKEANVLPDFNLEQLANLTEGYSGADIEGIVKEASSYALERLDQANISLEEAGSHSLGHVTMDDFRQAIAG